MSKQEKSEITAQILALLIGLRDTSNETEEGIHVTLEKLTKIQGNINSLKKHFSRKLFAVKQNSSTVWPSEIELAAKPGRRDLQLVQPQFDNGVLSRRFNNNLRSAKVDVTLLVLVDLILRNELIVTFQEFQEVFFRAVGIQNKEDKAREEKAIRPRLTRLNNNNYICYVENRQKIGMYSIPPEQFDYYDDPVAFPELVQGITIAKEYLKHVAFYQK